MSSKFIKNNRVVNQSKTVLRNTKREDMWYSFSSPSNSERLKEEENRLYYQNKLKEKNRIESIPLEELSFKDLYKFPFHRAKYGSWVYDADSNFIFQFEFDNEDTRNQIIDILNGDIFPKKQQDLIFKDGEVLVKVEGDFKSLILIRGWGNLTGTGAYNLDGKWASKIQDTLGEYIVEKLKI